MSEGKNIGIEDISKILGDSGKALHVLNEIADNHKSHAEYNLVKRVLRVAEISHGIAGYILKKDTALYDIPEIKDFITSRFGQEMYDKLRQS